MTAITDSQIFGNAFSTLEISKIWSDHQRTQYYLDFEAALARAQAQLGIIPQNACNEIVKHCSLEHLDFDLLRQQTELIGYPVLPVVQQLVKKINAVENGLGEWIHWGTTTQVRLQHNLNGRSVVLNA
jgi:3-carboxy-cis,cis-muconate cycloisomerase